MKSISSIFRNLSINYKIASISVLALLSSLAIGVFLYISHDATLESLETTDQSVELLAVVEESVAITEQSKASILQGMLWKMSYVEDKKVQEVLDESKALPVEMKELITRYQKDILAVGVTPEELDNLLNKNDEYLKSLKGTADMIMIDPDTATIMLNDTFIKFDETSALLSEVVEKTKTFEQQTVEHLTKTLDQGLYIVMGAIVISSIILFILGRVIAYIITRPIQDLTQVMTTLADGDLTIAIHGADRGDEVGNMARAVEVFKDSLITSERLQEEQELQQKEDLKRAEKLSEIVRLFEEKVTKVVSMFTQSSKTMEQAANTLSGSVDTSERTTTNVQAASTEAMTNVQTVAAAVQEMSASVNEISSQVQKTQNVIASSVEKTEYADAETERLASSTEKIGEIIGLIQDIAEQTNLLALNATIEAARAGDAGKGFAVVASEVKLLASQTAEATEQIAENIRDMQGISSSVIEAIANIREAIQEVNHYSSAVASAIEEQSSVTNEIASNMSSASQGVDEINENMEQVANAVAEVKVVAEKIQATSGELSEHTNDLNKDVGKFCSDVNNV